MPTINEIQGPLGVAIAQLEDAKLYLLEVFRLCGVPGLWEPGEKSTRAMQIAVVQTLLPVIDMELSKAFEAITGNPLPHHVTTVQKHAATPVCAAGLHRFNDAAPTFKSRCFRCGRTIAEIAGIA